MPLTELLNELVKGGYVCGKSMKTDFRLRGKVFVITSGAGILCSEMARRLNEHGAITEVLDRLGDKTAVSLRG